MSTNIALSWANLKAAASSRSLAMQYFATPDLYYILGFDGLLILTCTLPITTPASADQTDFETNYKAGCNKVLLPRDANGSSLYRQVQTTPGWTFQDHNFEYQAGTLGSVFSVNAAGTAFGFTTLNFYEMVSGAESLITGTNATSQTYLTANAIRTDVIWEMTNDFDVIEGDLRFFDTITSDVHLFTVIAPDVSYAYGGSRELITGGKNLRFIRPQDPVAINGRVSKHLAYSSVYHTNTFQIILRHIAGFSSRFAMAIQLYKA